MEVAEMLRSYEEHHNLPPLQELTAWEWCCLDSSSQGINKAQNEQIPTNQSTDNPYGIGKGGGFFDQDDG